MARPGKPSLPVAESEPRNYSSLLLESLALRHQIAVLKRSQTPRPCFRFIDRLCWILLSRWWPQWRESLVIVQAETVLRWRRNGWSVLWRYRSRGRWRGGRPRVSIKVRHLIAQMVRENFLWGAPRIHGELLMLGFTVSQATVSRYLPAPSRRPTQSWRTFVRNQALAFGEYSEERSREDGRPHGQSRWARSCDRRQHRLRLHVSGSDAELASNSAPLKLEESVCRPPCASDALCIERMGPRRYQAVPRRC